MYENHIMPIVVGYDRWNARQIVKFFEEHYGSICVDIPQTVKGLSSNLKIYKAKLKSKKIIFNDPVSTFCHMNVMVKTDHNNNIFPSKIKSKERAKIDVFASQLNAFIAYELDRENLGYYFERGLQLFSRIINSSSGVIGLTILFLKSFVFLVNI